MIFWILVVLIVLIAIAMFISEWGDSYGYPFVLGFMSLFIGSMVGGVILIAFIFLIPVNRDLVQDDTHQLKAIGNSSAIEGRSYFIGGGYIKDKRVLNFISQRDGGAIKVEQAKAEDATIYEGANGATVRVKHFDYTNGWVAPWPLGDDDEYEFRIPSGSVVESYTLDNK